MDLIGKLTLTDNGNQYICVIIDYLTKWPQAYPLKSKSAIEVTQCLINFVHQFEAPKRVLTDQWTEFVNQASFNMNKLISSSCFRTITKKNFLFVAKQTCVQCA